MVEQREKERHKYLKQKENKVKKSITEITPRAQRQTRKKWRDNSRKYRLVKKEIEKECTMLRENTPPLSSDEDNVENRPPRRNVGRRIANRNKIKRYRERKVADIKMKQLKNKVELYKKRYYRVLEKLKPNNRSDPDHPDLTPEVKVTAVLSGSKIEPSKVHDVKNRLLFGEAVQKQLVETYKKLKTDRSKQVFKKILDGKIIRKYKIRTKLSTIMGYRKTSNYDCSDNQFS